DQASLILESVNKSLLVLEENPSDADSFGLLQRALHTLKGDANSVGFTEIGGLSHKLEDLLELMAGADSKLKREIIELLIFGADALAATVQRKGQWLHTPLDVKPVLERIDQYIKSHISGKRGVADADASLFEMSESQLSAVRIAAKTGKKILRV